MQIVQRIERTRELLKIFIDLVYYELDPVKEMRERIININFYKDVLYITTYRRLTSVVKCDGLNSFSKLFELQFT